MQVEIKEIPFAKGYFCDTLGNVFLNKKKISQRPGGYKKRYLRCVLNKKDFFVHRVMLLTFVGQPPKGFQACHNNGNPRDNRLENLRWDTPKNNSLDKIKHGTSGKGQKNSMAKLTDTEAFNIIGIYQLIKSPDLADSFGVSMGLVTGIATGRLRFNKKYENLYRINKEVAQKRIELARNSNAK